MFQFAIPPALLAAFVATAFVSSTADAQVLALKSPTKSSPSARVPDEDAVRAWALSFEDALRRRSSDECAELLDSAALLERASKGIPATEKVKRNFHEGAREALNAESGLVSSAVATISAGGTVRWLGATEEGTERTALFRLTRADASAPEYLEFVLAAHGERGAIAVDFESSADAVPYSRVLRRWMLALVADAGRSLPERIAGQDREFAKAGHTFETIDMAFEAGRNADALAAWATLPKALRQDPSVVLSRLRAAFASGASTFDTVLAEVRAAGVDDTAVDLLAIDVAMATNRPVSALNAIDALAAKSARDPYLDALRGSILRDLGRRDEARAACRRAIGADPTLEEAYWTLLGIAIEQRQFDEALTHLIALDQRFEIDWRGLTDSPAYAAFLESKPGSRWRAKFASGR